MGFRKLCARACEQKITPKADMESSIGLFCKESGLSMSELGREMFC